MATTAPLPDLNDSIQAQVYAAACICLPFAIASVVLRFVARRLTGANLWLDDWFVLVGLVGDVGFFICTMVLLQNGMGRHFEVDSMDQYTSFAKTYIPAACFYALSLGTTKTSLLLLYYRIFKSTTWIRLPIYLTSFVILGWATSVILVSIFSCTPVAYWWDRTIPGGHCVNNTAFLLGNTIPNIATDFIILGLPLPCIWKLNQSIGRKIVISGLFLLGSFVCIITIIRLVIQLNTDFTNPDLTWNITNFVTWTNAEASLAIVSACLPCLRPIVTYLKNGGKVSQARSTAAQYTDNSKAGWERQGTKHYASAMGSSSHDRNWQSVDEYPLVERA